MRKYYVIESETEDGIRKSIEVTDDLRDAREKLRLFENSSYRPIGKQEARRIAQTTQWGLLPEDLESLLPGKGYFSRRYTTSQKNIINFPESSNKLNRTNS